MVRGFLIPEGTTPGERRRIMSKALVIGRAPDCDIVVSDAAASRRHVEIRMREERFFWRDLGSRNGTTLNGRRMLDGELKVGDIIGIGDLMYRFELEEDAGEPALKPGSAGPLGIAGMPDIPTPIVMMAPAPQPPPVPPAPQPPPVPEPPPPPVPEPPPAAIIEEPSAPEPVPVPSPGAIEDTVLAVAPTETTEEMVGTVVKSEAVLQAVYAVMGAVASNYDCCDLVDRILESSMKAIHAQRAAVFFGEEDGDGLCACPVCGQIHVIREGTLERVESGRIHISSTVAKRVLKGGESILYQDTDADSELQVAESVMALNLRSILCAPLRAKTAIRGILYVDTDRVNEPYTREDMLLVTAVGTIAGLALENAAMHGERLEKQRMEQEIAHAAIIQEGFLIKEWPDNEARFQVWGETHPARIVGGDFYDFVQLSADRVGILAGDVSGKGVPAALAMAQLLAQFRLHVRDHPSPSGVLKLLNDDLAARSRRGMFCTACYLVLDLGTGHVQCANAGHHPPVYINEQGARCFGHASGPPLGVAPALAVTDTEWEVKLGDTVLLYTDGIVEAKSPAHLEEYGIESLYQVAQTCRECSPKELIKAVEESVRQHCGAEPPNDDRTLIALKRCGYA